MSRWLGRLSPRRRVFVVGTALMITAIAAAVAVAVVVTITGRPSPATGDPAQNRPGPVVLVPGYGGNTNSLAVLASRIRALGRTVSVVHLPGNGTGSLVADAAAIGAVAGRYLRGGAPSVDVVGYSAGGVATLIWARDDGGASEARRVVTLGSPFHGTRLAAAAVGFVPGECPLACQQLTPGSSLLRQLDTGPVPARPRWLSLWTTDDTTVTPPVSARLPGAINVAVQSVCPGQDITHTELPSSPAVVAMVLHAIGAGPVQHPSPADCSG